MKTIDLNGITNLQIVHDGTDEWYWSTDYIHGDLYEAEDLFRMGHSVRSNKFYLLHYPDGAVYEPVPPVPGQYIGYPVYDNGSVALLVVNFPESMIRIMRFDLQQKKALEVTQLPLSSVETCYNLRLYTNPLTLTVESSDNVFELVWPERARFTVGIRETLNFRDGEKLYFTVWYEDPDYREETVVRSIWDGAEIERFHGSITIMPNGDKWLLK